MKPVVLDSYEADSTQGASFTAIISDSTIIGKIIVNETNKPDMSRSCKHKSISDKREAC